MNIGDTIINLREIKGITQSELAEKVKIHKSTMSRIERNERPLRSDELLRILDFFNVSADSYLGRKMAACSSDFTRGHEIKDCLQESTEGN